MVLCIEQTERTLVWQIDGARWFAGTKWQEAECFVAQVLGNLNVETLHYNPQPFYLASDIFIFKLTAVDLELDKNLQKKLP